jgi:hypothetical protein
LEHAFCSTEEPKIVGQEGSKKGSQHFSKESSMNRDTAFAFENFVNRRVGTLKVLSIVRRDERGAPVYSVHCQTCNSTGQAVNHKDLKAGKAHCLASGCGKAAYEELSRGGGATIAHAGIRSADSESRRAFQQTDTTGASYQEALNQYCEYAYKMWNRHGICIVTFEEFRRMENL